MLSWPFWLWLILNDVTWWLIQAIDDSTKESKEHFIPSCPNIISDIVSHTGELMANATIRSTAVPKSWSHTINWPSESSFFLFQRASAAFLAFDVPFFLLWVADVDHTNYYENVWSALRKRLNLIWEVELKDETSQTHQFGHTKQIQALFPDKTASRQGLSYEGSSKKHKNTYLWTRCGPNCCTLEHVYEKILQFVSIWERMWEMHFIRSGDVSRLRFAILKALTLTNL